MIEATIQRCVAIGHNAQCHIDDEVVITNSEGVELFREVNPKLAKALKDVMPYLIRVIKQSEEYNK